MKKKKMFGGSFRWNRSKQWFWGVWRRKTRENEFGKGIGRIRMSTSKKIKFTWRRISRIVRFFLFSLKFLKLMLLFFLDNLLLFNFSLFYSNLDSLSFFPYYFHVVYRLSMHMKVCCPSLIHIPLFSYDFSVHISFAK